RREAHDALANHACLLELLDAPRARRRRQADPIGDLLVRKATVLLQKVEDLQVVGVELQGWIRGHQDRSADVKPGELLRICAAVSKFALKDAPSAAGSVRLVERAALSAATGVTHDVWSGQGSA